MALRRFRPITRDLVFHLRGVPDESAAHAWGLADGDPLPVWVEASLDAWGIAGVYSRTSEGPCFLLVTPGEALPLDHPMRRIPRTPGAAVLVAACVSDAARGSRGGRSASSGRTPSGHGFATLPGRANQANQANHDADRTDQRDRFHSVTAGRQLTSFLAGRLHGCVPAIEAGGVEGGSPDLRVAPKPWLESLGFRLVDPLDAAPVSRMQLDLRQTVVSKDFGHRILGWVRGWSSDPAPEPCGAESRRTHRLDHAARH
jgi:hypothetical protein